MEKMTATERVKAVKEALAEVDRKCFIELMKLLNKN